MSRDGLSINNLILITEKCIKPIMSKLSTINQLFGFLWRQKKFWLIPIVIVLFLLIILALLGEGSVVAPFIYSIF